MAGPRPQLTLDLYRAPALDFDSFHAGGNDEAVVALRRWCEGAGAPVIWLSGAPATGKTHLLQAAVRAAGARAMYLPLADMRAYDCEMLDDLQAVDLLALDDVDSCAGDPAWERALFRLYNDRQAANLRLLWSAHTPPAVRLFKLDDLQSRAAAGLIYQLRELDDTDKGAALRAAALRRGLVLPEAVADYILRRERRDMSALAGVLDRLDRASLQESRALTVPFVREVLAG